MQAETDELLKQKLVEYMGHLESAVKSASDGVVDEVPKVVDEYLRWIAWSNGAGLVVATLVFILSLVALIKLWKKLDSDKKPLVMFVALPLGLGLGFMLGCSHRLIKVTVAPRVVILEKIADMAD